MRAETFSVASGAVSITLAALGWEVGPTSSALVPILMGFGGAFALSLVGAWIATLASRRDRP